MCKYNPYLRKYIDIFTNLEMNSDRIKSVVDISKYLKENNIKCNYQKLNIYSLLRLYHEINRVNDFINIDNNLEELVANELQKRGIYKKSKLYKKKSYKVNIH